MNVFSKLSPFVLILAACATTHPGHEGVSLNKESQQSLKISAESPNKSKDEAFQLLELTLENTSDNWARYTRGKILIGNPAESKLSVVVGKDLRDWAQAMELRLRQDQHNQHVAQLGLVVVGSVASATGKASKNRSLETAGALAALGGYGWAVSEVISQSLDAAMKVETTPENHIHQPFSVPGKMFTRKWVLINKPSGVVIDRLVIELESIDGKRDTYEIKL